MIRRLSLFLFYIFLLAACSAPSSEQAVQSNVGAGKTIEVYRAPT